MPRLQDALVLAQSECAALASRLGLTEELLASGEEGLQFQSRAHDNLLRAFFAVPEVRLGLCAEGANPAFGAVVEAGR